jgi:hypothetical protein
MVDRVWSSSEEQARTFTSSPNGFFGHLPIANIPVLDTTSSQPVNTIQIDEVSYQLVPLATDHRASTDTVELVGRKPNQVEREGV